MNHLHNQLHTGIHQLELATLANPRLRASYNDAIAWFQLVQLISGEIYQEKSGEIS